MARPRNADGQRTRQAILDAALDLFAQKGFFGTSLRDVATAVGVRESALYNYFPSKDALFEALILADQHSKVERLTELAEERITDVRVFLEQLVIEAFQSFAEPRHQQLFRIMMSDGIRLARDGRINLFERLGDRRERMDGHHAPPDPRRLAARGRSPDARDAHSAAPLFMAPAPAGGRRRPAVDPQARGIRPAARRAVPPRRLGSRSQTQSGAPRRRHATAPGGTPRASHASTLMTIMSIPFGRPRGVLSIIVLCVALLANACTRANGEAAAPAEVAAVSVGLATAVEQPVTRFIRVSGTLTAEEDADVAAEIAGRVIATPVERGTRVNGGGDLVRIAAVEAEAQAREAQANAAQIEARLGIANGAAFDAERVPGSGERQGRPCPGPDRLRARQDAVRETAALAVRVRPAPLAG